MTRYFKIDPEQHMIELPDSLTERHLADLERRIYEAIDNAILLNGLVAGGIGLIEVDGETGQALQAAPTEGN